jgi:HSP20 family protein
MTLFNSLFDLTREGTLWGNGTARMFLPLADVVVSDEAVTVTMDVPGLSTESLEIELAGDVLTIRGERQYPQFDRDSTQWYRVERGYGKFQRILQVPKGLDPDTVKASIADGVLTIHVPLPEARKPHRIQIANVDQQPAIESAGGWEEVTTKITDTSPAEEPELVGAAA